MTTKEWIDEWDEFINTHPLLQLDEINISLNIPEDPADMVATNESFWKHIQSLYPHPENHINLNNGGVCSNTLLVEKAFLSYYSLLNTSPSYFTWKVMEAGRETVKKGLAHMIHAQSEEIAIFRNATEALNNAIFGIPLNEGDEIVACNQDYIKCVSSWKQRQLREKINIHWIDITGTETNDEVVEKYVNAFTPKTKVLHLTHIINWNGQILPVEMIAKEAKKRGIIVLLDAAHSFAVLETDVTKIECDYLGAALHKWLSGPIAAGMLYVKKDMIANTFPLASSVDPLSNNIKKFEEMSIQLLPNLLGLGYAIQFHLLLGREVKEARLNYLRSRWTDVLKNNKQIHFNIPLNRDQCKAIANFRMANLDPFEIEKQLFEKYKIHVSAFNWPNLSGIRITPNIYTTVNEIDHLAKAVEEIAASLN